ncbi:hypothetical protein A1359_15220 [Methylomonas lenta]|uniref:DUF6701 domain-containing protein n=1 Tax=Methylomonas lenta TaxID=980561 RepID=A0A177MZB6_9GAMM|nr:hypothetical protein A1359_15220 [Methylomonas lenta]
MWCRLTFCFVAIYSAPLIATTYSVIPYPFNWVDATAHIKIGPTTGGVYSSIYKFTNSGDCGTSPPILDDTISDPIPLGFTFKYGSKSFTSVRVMSNGRLQFDNNTCGFGSPVTQLPYPVSSLQYSMRIYGNDMDPTMKSEASGYSTNCTSRSSCYVSYSSDGSSPNRRFIVTWNNVPEWAAASSATGSYNLQLIVYENGEFLYQYGNSSPGPSAKLGQIGWEVDTTDYAVAGTGFPADQSALLFYIPNSGSMKPGAFNAFDTSTWSGSTVGVIQTKVAGTPFTLDVVALNAIPSVLTTFTGAVKVEIVDTNSAASCSAMTVIQTITSSYTFKSTDNGRHTFSAINQANSYPNLQVRIAYPATNPTSYTCSTDQFAIRPSYFGFVASDNDWSTAGVARNLNAVTVSATPTHKAGQPLTLTIKPYNSLGAVTNQYNGSPILAVTCVLPVSNCISGTFNVGTFSSSGGVSTSNTASYNEVGAVSVTVTDSTFAQIDASDGTSASNRTITSAASNVGRFVPDHFDVNLNSPLFTSSCGTFSYIGQPIKYATRPVVSVTAKNSDNVITQNYKSDLWKINPTHVTYGITPSYSEATQPLTVLNTNSPVLVDNGNGSGTLSFADTTSNILAVTRSNPIVPFNAEIAMSFNLQDTDAVTVANINGFAATNPVRFGTTSVGNGIGFSSGNKGIRWGRMSMQNSFGSELLPLALPLFSEYFNGSSFLLNNVDNCTTLTLSSQLMLSNPVTANGAAKPGNTVMTITPSGTSQATLTHSTLVAGDAGLSFSAPGSGNTGYIDINANFSSLPWLLFDWDHDGNQNNSPAARANFGIYKGNSKQIYWREVY